MPFMFNLHAVPYTIVVAEPALASISEKIFRWA
jgi:hypothetical protein